MSEQVGQPPNPQRALQTSGVIPTGSLRLDLALGIGGIPGGQVIEISGPEAVGKTALCLHIVAEAQRMGKTCAWIDADHTFDPVYARKRGIDAEKLLIAEPESAEQALEILITLARSGAVALIVLDSVAALAPQAELQAELSAPAPDQRDELLSRSLRSLTRELRKSKTSLIFTNRATLGKSAVYHKLAPNIARLALKLHASIRVTLTHLEYLHYNDEISGSRIQARVVKNTLCPGFRTTELDLLYNDGIIKSGEIFDLGVQLMLVTRQGSDYYFHNYRLGRERKEAIDFLRQNESIAWQIEQVIRQKLLQAAA